MFLICPVVRSGRTLSSVAAVALPDEDAEKEQEEREELAAQQANWSKERIIAEGLAAKLVQQWQGPISTLARAGKAFEGLEALLGGGTGGGGFDLGVSSAREVGCSHVQSHAEVDIIESLTQEA